MEKNRILLAGKKKEGWKYSYFNDFFNGYSHVPGYT